MEYSFHLIKDSTNFVKILYGKYSVVLIFLLFYLKKNLVVLSRVRVTYKAGFGLDD
jgi:hypothetical protein